MTIATGDLLRYLTLIENAAREARLSVAISEEINQSPAGRGIVRGSIDTLARIQNGEQVGPPPEDTMRRVQVQHRQKANVMLAELESLFARMRAAAGGELDPGPESA